LVTETHNYAENSGKKLLDFPISFNYFRPQYDIGLIGGDMNKDEEIKDAIKDAAKRVFSKWGLNKTTMEDIAHEAGKGKSTLYYYFKSKEEIFENVAIDELTSISKKAKAAIDGIASPKDKLKKYIAVTLTEIKKAVNIYSLIRGEIKGNKEFIDNIRKRIDKKEENIIREILKLGFKSNEFNFLKESELDKAANVIVLMIRGLELQLILENDDSEKMDIAIRFLVEGL
jgi:AcrR family transcriptional regulator